MLDIMQKLVPGLRAVGTMYNPAEANSVKEHGGRPRSISGTRHQAGADRRRGSNEVLQAVQILAGRDIQVVWLPGRQYRHSRI